MQNFCPFKSFIHHIQLNAGCILGLPVMFLLFLILVGVYASRRETTTLPPAEQVGKAKLREYETLYGSDARRILSLEADVQMKFDECYNAEKPPLWPNIPLKL